MKKMIYTIICAGSLFCLSKGESQTRSLDEKEFSHSWTGKEETVNQTHSFPTTKADDNQNLTHHPYYNFGVNHYILPSVGIGYRIQSGANAFDTNFSISALNFGVLELSANYLAGKDLYIGSGLVFDLVYSPKESPSMEFFYGLKAIGGIRFTEKTFAQVEGNLMIVPFIGSISIPLPTLSLRVGRNF